MSDVKVWSPYSEAIFDTWLSAPESNLIISACPGSGKTTNLMHLCTDVINANDETCVLAFGRANVEELRDKVPPYMRDNVMTLNGLGHRAIMATYGRVTVDKDKVFKIIRKECKQGRLETRNEYNDRVSEIAKAVALLKINIDVGEYSFSSLCTTFDIDEYDGMYSDCSHVLAVSDTDVKVIDFNDQIRFPVLYDLDMRSFDNVLVDEAQDLNSLQASLITKLHGRYCFVGDPHQAIYGFRGAMHNSMEYLKDRFECVELPLKLSYRCSQSVVDQARLLFDDIEALPDASLGSVRYVSGDEKQSYTATDLIVCRNNAPIIEYAYALLKQGVGCRVKGRDIGTGLVKLVDKLCLSGSVTMLSTLLTAWREAQIEKAKGDTAKEQRIRDKADSLAVVIAQCSQSDTVINVKVRIDQLFNRDSGVLLSTVHRAKGLEANNVYILKHRLMPSKYAVQDWEREQEKNMQYVAVTRAKSNLVYM